MPADDARASGPIAETIDQVIARLDAIIAEARRRGGREGYFAALYKRVTVRVRDGIAAGEFEDGARMARLDVIFANRYLEAYALHAAGAPTTRCWGAAFEAAPLWRPLVLQHLLVGMNAHINLDLGIAAARTAPGAALAGLRPDFERINVILAELTTTVKQEMEGVWPALRLIDHLADREENAIVNFSIDKARDAAWSLAQRLAPLALEEQATLIVSTDAWVADLGQMIANPGLLLKAALLLIRLGERGSVPQNIDLLNR
jgi:hypothetical protein